MSSLVIRRGRRLEMYRQGADTPEYWDAHWKEHPPEAMAGMGIYCGFREAIERFMPQGGLIVEAGCGNGNTARTIRAAGYEIEGVDFAPEVIDANRVIDPAGRYRVADVRNLTYDSNSLAGYISLGVIEHFSEVDRRAILLEAARCLEPGGTALFTVPYFNRLRRVRWHRFSGRTPPESVPFYQFFFGAEELCAELRAVGLHIQHVDAYDAYKGLKDTLGCKGMLDRLRARGPRWRRLVDHPPRWLRLMAGHMLLVVAGKPECEAVVHQGAA